MRTVHLCQQQMTLDLFYFGGPLRLAHWTFLRHQSSCICMLPWQYTVMSFIIEILWNNLLWSKYKTGTHKCICCFVFSLYWVMCSKNLFFTAPFKIVLCSKYCVRLLTFSLIKSCSMSGLVAILWYCEPVVCGSAWPVCSLILSSAWFGNIKASNAFLISFGHYRKVKRMQWTLMLNLQKKNQC